MLALEQIRWSLLVLAIARIGSQCPRCSMLALRMISVIARANCSRLLLALIAGA
jgi:hypothetical protein